MTQEQVLSGLKKDVRSLLVSAKNGLSPEQLKRDYYSMLGHPLPLRPLGFRNILDMVKEMPDVVSVDYSSDGSLVLKVVGDKTTKGIEQLVSKQRNPKSKPTARKQVLGSHFPRYLLNVPLHLPRRGHAPPALPAQLRSQLRQLLSQGPVSLSELEPCFARLFGRPLQVMHYGFYSIAEMLAAASDLVDIKQSRTGSLLMLRTPKKPLVQTVSPALSPPPSIPSADKAPVGTGGSTSIFFYWVKHMLTDGQKNKPEFPQESGPCGTPGDGRRRSEVNRPAPKPVLEEKAFEKCVKKLEEELRNGILESGAAGTVSPELKEQLHQVVAQNSEGISIHDFPGEFKRVIGVALPVVQCGFLSVTEMVSALSDILYLEPGPEKEANSWIVKGNLQGRGQDNGVVATETSESLNPSKRGYYFNSEESPWEGRDKEGERVDVLEVDTDLRVTTKTFSQVVDAFPAPALTMSGMCLVPPDALREERLRPPTRRRERELAPVLVERVESPSHFYIRFHETQEARALENMMIEMRTCYTCPEVAERYRLPESYVRPGQVCCIAPRGMWFYRVIVHRVLNRGQVEVYYVDFGDLSTAETSSLRFLKSCYSELPAQAVPSSLTGVRPIGGSWSTSAVSCFQKLCCERTLVAAIHSHQDDVLHLFLCDTHTEEDVYIHTALKEAGHALSCTTFYSRVIFGQFNPVSLYMETGLHKERTALCSLGSAGDSPDKSILGKLQTQPGSPQTGPSPGGGVKLHSIREEVDLPDLPELEFISIPEVNSPAQAENANPFGALLCKGPEYFSDWDQGWTPGSASEDTLGHGDAEEQRHPSPGILLCPGQKGSGGGTASGAGLVKDGPQPVAPPLQQAVAPETSGPWSSETTPVRTRDCGGGVSSLAVQQPVTSFLFPWLRHTSPTVLGPAAQLAAGTHLLSWYPHKMA
ncbi:tudor domain-containing protein 5 isoform X2 [Anguilla rostrata]|uniref:tudor domain-containing protein 5 isoform X2 n=1 Tax=Anguilla rostrata TaxID=7938 RepID=UPI0030D005F4